MILSYRTPGQIEGQLITTCKLRMSAVCACWQPLLIECVCVDRELCDPGQRRVV